jgi:hypothetical protein
VALTAVLDQVCGPRTSSGSSNIPIPPNASGPIEAAHVQNVHGGKVTARQVTTVIVATTIVIVVVVVVVAAAAVVVVCYCI